MDESSYPLDSDLPEPIKHLDDYLVGGPRKYTFSQAISAVGIHPERARSAWAALGFAIDDSRAKSYTDADLEILSLLGQFDEMQPSGHELGTARAIGSAMSRLAEWQSAELVELLAADNHDADVEELIVAFARIQDLVWRRHLTGSLTNSLEQRRESGYSISGALGEVQTRIVGFADLVGFTSLTRRLSPVQLTQLVDRFENTTIEVITRNGGTVIKTIGDEIMFTCTFGDDAAAIAHGLHKIKITDVNPDQDDNEVPLPPLRVGMALGEVVVRLGDVFGETVNIAARLTASARPGTTLIDTGLADEISPSLARIRSIPPLFVRGYRKLSVRRLDDIDTKKTLRRS